MTLPRVRLYGYGSSESSFTQVTRGMGAALEAASELDHFFPMDLEAVGDGEDMRGALAPVSLNIGDPNGLLRAHRAGSHRSHWLLLAPNSETLPYGFMEGLLKPSSVLPKGMLTGGLLAPSAWAASVIRRYVPDSMPVVVAPHGVTPRVHKTFGELRAGMLDLYDQHERFDVLHMTSSETERKGTKLLLRAWKQLKRTGHLPPKAKLYVMMNPLHVSKIKWWCSDLGLTEDDVQTEPGLTNSQEDIALLYGSVHAVCQPSRGEGFGLVPLEALACGVPVIATACTGHSEYLGTGQPGATIVHHGSVALMDDFPGSMAPLVIAEAIESALVECYGTWKKLAAAAEENSETIRTEWSWVNKNGPAIRRMLQEAYKHV